MVFAGILQAILCVVVVGWVWALVESVKMIQNSHWYVSFKHNLEYTKSPLASAEHDAAAIRHYPKEDTIGIT